MSAPDLPGIDPAEIARLRETFAAGSGRPVPEECPEPGRLWEGAAGELPADELRTVIDHLAACPDCSEEWRLALAVREEAEDQARRPEAAAAASTASAERRARWGALPRTARRWAAAAAVAVIGLGLAGVWWSQQQGPDGPAVYRQGEEVAIESLLPEGESLSREEPVLRWSAGPEGSTYDVLVSTEELATVAEAAGLTEPEYRISGDALEGLPSATRILWQVEAVTPDGNRIASATFVTELE